VEGHKPLSLREKEKDMTENKVEMWSMDDLIALTDEIQSEDLDYKGKSITVQWCELVESEEPKMMIPDDGQTEEEKNAYYSELANKKILKMIEKANEKNSEGTFINEEVWSKLPTSLKYKISAKVMGTENDVNF
jgi:hypothetical protein|tara:strand:+ start:3704 stop:4105 length:402 start_codon:yes stop_codon:yes gene_type:complete